MQIKKTLEKLNNLFQKWGLEKDDWSLVGEWALRLRGYDIQPRKGHIDIQVNRRKLPWKVRPGEDSTIPPKNSREFQVFKEFVRQTRFGPHLIPLPLDPCGMGVIVKDSTFYSLPDKNKIRIEKPKAQIIQRVKILKSYVKQGVWDEKKIKRWLDYFQLVKKAAEKKKDEKLIRACQLALKNCEEMKTKFTKSSEIEWKKLGQWKNALLFLYFIYEGEKKNFLTGLGLGKRTEMKNRLYLESKYMVDERDWEYLRNCVQGRIEEDKMFFKKYAAQCYKANQQLLSISEKIKELQNVDSLTNEQLKKFFVQYMEIVESNIPFLDSFVIIDEILAERIQKALFQLLKKRKMKISFLADYLNELTPPKKLVLWFVNTRNF